MDHVNVEPVHIPMFLQENSEKELNDIAGFDKIESKQKNGAQESDNFQFFFVKIVPQKVVFNLL